MSKKKKKIKKIEGAHYEHTERGWIRCPIRNDKPQYDEGEAVSFARAMSAFYSWFVPTSNKGI